MTEPEGPAAQPARPGWLERLHRVRGPLQVGADLAAWSLALWAATLLRFEFDLPQHAPSGIVVMVVVALAVQLAAGLGAGLYMGRWRYGSFDEMAAVVQATGLTTIVIAVLNRQLFDTAIPEGYTITDMKADVKRDGK